ncbi:MAG: MBL fold metallo-hydrolase [Pseudomonadota bacterium]
MTNPSDDPFDRDPGPPAGEPVALEPGIRRLTCPNPSPMTFTGTQTYVIGTGDVALVDPGPEVSAHREAILNLLAPDERVAWIVVTHTHVDHSPGVAALKAATGAKTAGFGRHGTGMSARMRALEASNPDLGGGEGADRAFVPDVTLADGEALEGAGWRLTALHTPGHLSNHLSFAVEGDGIAPGAVLSGDHVMAWATTTVSPPDGDMAAFLQSLRRLQGRGDRVFYPGHGAPVRDPEAMIAYQLAHREARARQVREALERSGPDGATPMELTRRIYDDVDPALHGAASRNVLSALLGMLDEGGAAHDGPLGPAARFRAA